MGEDAFYVVLGFGEGDVFDELGCGLVWVSSFPFVEVAWACVV